MFFFGKLFERIGHWNWQQTKHRSQMNSLGTLSCPSGLGGINLLDVLFWPATTTSMDGHAIIQTFVHHLWQLFFMHFWGRWVFWFKTMQSVHEKYLLKSNHITQNWSLSRTTVPHPIFTWFASKRFFCCALCASYLLIQPEVRIHGRGAEGHRQFLCPSSLWHALWLKC